MLGRLHCINDSVFVSKANLCDFGSECSGYAKLLCSYARDTYTRDSGIHYDVFVLLVAVSFCHEWRFWWVHLEAAQFSSH